MVYLCYVYKDDAPWYTSVCLCYVLRGQTDYSKSVLCSVMSLYHI